MKTILIALNCLLIFCSLVKAQSTRDVCFDKYESVSIDSLNMRIEISKNQASTLVQLFIKGSLVDETALVNVENSTRIKAVKLNKENPTSFVQTFPIFGSTFGAVWHIIIWKDGYAWSITKVPFIKAKILDTDNDGVFEFKEVHGSQQFVYNFKDGIFYVR